MFNTNETCESGYLKLKINLSQEILIRNFIETDFMLIKRLYEQEGWMTFINREDDALQAWKNSNIKLVATHDDKIIGLVRGLSDGKITTYIAEIIVDTNYRGKGIGKTLLEVCHYLYPKTRFDLLSSESADEFYKSNNFRMFTGFRKSY